MINTHDGDVGERVRVLEGAACRGVKSIARGGELVTECQSILLVIVIQHITTTRKRGEQEASGK